MEIQIFVMFNVSNKIYDKFNHYHTPISQNKIHINIYFKLMYLYHLITFGNFIVQILYFWIGFNYPDWAL